VNRCNYHTTPEANSRRQFLVNLAPKNIKIRILVNKINFSEKYEKIIENQKHQYECTVQI
jgi:hypothetical protein